MLNLIFAILIFYSLLYLLHFLRTSESETGSLYKVRCRFLCRNISLVVLFSGSVSLLLGLVNHISIERQMVVFGVVTFVLILPSVLRFKQLYAGHS